ncbi:MAG TPA: cytochrome c [Terriglobales bacterium]|jgi:mono/diheme cytochrome c family protein|nr:cytochrome c [Terriglobales bacterium]
MRMRFGISVVLLVTAMFIALAAVATASGRKENKDTPAASSAPATNQPDQSNELRLEGEKRFRANCGRCHTAPPKFPPRMMGTIVRHMRVRAMLTDQDMRLILRYMTQ